MHKIHVTSLLFLFLSLVASAVITVEFAERDEKHLKINRQVCDLLFPTSESLGLESLPLAQRIRVTCSRTAFLTFLSLLLDRRFKDKSIERIREFLFPINTLSLSVQRIIPTARIKEIEGALSWWKSSSQKGYKVFSDWEFESVHIPAIPWPTLKHKKTGLFFLTCEGKMSVPRIDSKYIINNEAFVKTRKKRLGLVGPITEGFCADKFSRISQSNFLGLSTGIAAIKEDCASCKVQEPGPCEAEVANFLFVAPDGSFKLAAPLIMEHSSDLNKILDSFWDLRLLLLGDSKFSLLETLETAESLASLSKPSSLVSIKMELIQTDDEDE